MIDATQFTEYYQQPQAPDADCTYLGDGSWVQLSDYSPTQYVHCWWDNDNVVEFACYLQPGGTPQ